MLIGLDFSPMTFFNVLQNKNLLHLLHNASLGIKGLLCPDRISPSDGDSMVSEPSSPRELTEETLQPPATPPEGKQSRKAPKNGKSTQPKRERAFPIFFGSTRAKQPEHIRVVLLPV